MEATKDKNYWKIMDAVLRLEVVKGHLRWKISDVSRLSGVNRTLIYYYFGKSKENIVKAALKLIGDEFCGLSPERQAMWKNGQIKQSLLDTRKLIERAPHILEFFFHWRYQKSEIQDELIAFQKRYLTKIKQHFPQVDPLDQQAMFAIVFGLVLVPELPEPVLERILSKVSEGF